MLPLHGFSMWFARLPQPRSSQPTDPGLSGQSGMIARFDWVRSAPSGISSYGLVVAIGVHLADLELELIVVADLADLRERHRQGAAAGCRRADVLLNADDGSRIGRGSERLHADDATQERVELVLGGGLDALRAGRDGRARAAGADLAQDVAFEVGVLGRDEIDVIRSGHVADGAADGAVGLRADLGQHLLDDDRTGLRHRVGAVLGLSQLAPGVASVDDQADQPDHHHQANGRDDERLAAFRPGAHAR